MTRCEGSFEKRRLDVGKAAVRTKEGNKKMYRKEIEKLRSGSCKEKR